MKEEKTYILKFVCNNCGHKFIKEIPFGKDVLPVHITINSMGYEIENGEKIRCPNCGSYRVSKKWE